MAKARALTAEDLPIMSGMGSEWRAGRSVRDGYARGWGLEYGDLATKVGADPLYQEASRLAVGRSLVTEARRMNQFLLLRFYLPRLARGNIIEFGAYKGGNAAFLGRVARETLPGAQIFALDTFAGMPPTDRAIDAHSGGDFGDAHMEEVAAFLSKQRLDNVHLVKGLFEETAGEIAARHGPFTLAHIDCDIYSAVAFAYNTVRTAMVPGGYIVFDDATTSSCIGATEVVEDLVVRRDGLSSEQIHPHFVFRA